MRRVLALVALAGVLAVLAGCAVVRQDKPSTADWGSVWGNTVQCASAARISYLADSGGAFRRLTVVDGDDFYGERCELANNESRYGENGGAGTFKLYRAGDHLITAWQTRLTGDFNLTSPNWQLVMQMKMTEPYAEPACQAPGCSPAHWLGLSASSYCTGSPAWSVTGFGQDYCIWSVPARAGVWTSIAYNVVYSTSPSVGSVQVTIDGQTSPVFHGQTIATAGTANSLYNVGDPIPAHLRLGIYHNPVYACPSGCSVDVRAVSVLKP